MGQSTSSRRLLSAAAQGDAASVARVLQTCRDSRLVSVRDVDGRQPLHLSAFNGYHSVTRVLLDHGAPVNTPADYGLTPLHLAAWRGHSQTVLELLRSGADPTAVTEPFPLISPAAERFTPSQLAQSPDVARLLINPIPTLHVLPPTHLNKLVPH